MSARLDYLVGGDAGYTGDDGLSGYVGHNTDLSTSGVMQSILTLGTGYVNGRIALDLQKRQSEVYMPQPGLRTTQYGQRYAAGGVVPAQGGGLNIGQLLPYALGAVLVFVLVRKVAK